jgi:hypothetical protein
LAAAAVRGATAVTISAGVTRSAAIATGDRVLDLELELLLARLLVWFGLVGTTRGELRLRELDVRGRVGDRLWRLLPRTARRGDRLWPACPALLGPLTIARHSDLGGSARLAVRGVAPAPAAVLAQLESFRVVALALVRLVVPALALLAREGHGYPDISTGHLCASRTR